MQQPTIPAAAPLHVLCSQQQAAARPTQNFVGQSCDFGGLTSALRGVIMSFMSLVSLATAGEYNMAEVTTTQAAEILAANKRTIKRRVDDGLLPARKQGLRGIAYIELEDLRTFAERYGYRYNDALAKQLAE